MSLVGPGDRRNSVLVRHGTIARLRDALEGNSPSFLIDTFVFPGNSGGPVVLKPEAFAIKGTKKVQSALLVGIVSGNVFFQDTAVSTQSSRPRVIFEDNAGLGVVYPVDAIEECIARCPQHARQARRVSVRAIPAKTARPQVAVCDSIRLGSPASVHPNSRHTREG